MSKLLTAALVVAISVLGLSKPASATIFHYFIHLDGPSEPTASPGLGTATADYDDAAHTLALNCTFSGLLGPTTASHIHAATTNPFTGSAGVATTTPSFVGFPLGVTSGSFSNTLDLTLASSYNPSYVTAQGGIPQAELALTTAMAQGKAYWNIHTQSFPGGEIRGFTPEPASLGLFGIAAALIVRRRRA